MALVDPRNRCQRPRLTSRYEKILELSLVGKSSVEIAREVKLSRSRISWIQNHDTGFLAALAFEQDALREANRARLAAAAGKAIGVLERLLDAADKPRVQAIAAGQLLRMAAEIEKQKSGDDAAVGPTQHLTFKQFAINGRKQSRQIALAEEIGPEGRAVVRALIEDMFKLAHDVDRKAREARAKQLPGPPPPSPTAPPRPEAYDV